jgi:hypothetical protein
MRSAVSGSVVTISNFPATQTVAGTVTASLANVVTNDNYYVAPAVRVMGAGNDGVLLAGIDELGNPANIYEDGKLPISGTVTANINDPTTALIANQIQDALFTSDSLINNLNSLLAPTNNIPISGTVTVGAMPSGALTTRFGSVVTANLATLTSAVTNASRKFLLVQNIATSTVTIGIGFAPTTTQGIQLTAGAGLTFDAFCPTGGVWWLSSTTGSNFSILEG